MTDPAPNPNPPPEPASGDDALRRELAAAQAAQKEAETGRDAARRDLADLVRRNRISELAVRHGCEDAGYLGYLADRAGVDVTDAAAAEAFLADLKTKSPKCFRAASRPGPADPPPRPSAEAPRSGDRLGQILESLKNAPEIR